MSVYIIRDIIQLENIISNIAKSMWNDTVIGSTIDLTKCKRYEFLVGNKTAWLDIYQRKDGATTFVPVGQNRSLSQELKEELEKQAIANTQEVITQSYDVAKEKIDNIINKLRILVQTEPHGKYNTKNNCSDKVHTFISDIGDKLTITVTIDGKIIVQGKNIYLYKIFCELFKSEEWKDQSYLY